MNCLNFIGRKDEYKILERSFMAPDAQLVIVYGRRRVGKTYLINQSFENEFAFKVTGSYKESLQNQLANFAMELARKSKKEFVVLTNWRMAFAALEDYLDSLPNDKKQVVFIDEMPWFDSKKSGFLPAFEYFWNNYGSAKNNLMLIVAGSASSWLSKKIVNNKGGLFNRHSARIYLKPFTLFETKEYLNRKGMLYSDYDIAQLYMIMGGIPFYLSQLDSSLSLNENIDNIFFKEKGLLWDEFDRLYHTLFGSSPLYQELAELLSKFPKGLSRNEIADKIKCGNNGSLSEALKSLIDSGFFQITISKRPRKETLYYLSDFYSLFYFKFIKENYRKNEHFWSDSIDLPSRRSWLGNTFELLCKMHLSQLKESLGISSVNADCYSFYQAGSQEEKGTQIDLVIDRRDNVASLLEMKFSLDEFVIDKDYFENLSNKINVYHQQNKRKSIQLVMVTTFGVKKGMYCNIVNREITLMDLFK